MTSSTSRRRVLVDSPFDGLSSSDEDDLLLTLVGTIDVTLVATFGVRDSL